jgi:hypothetical protein
MLPSKSLIMPGTAATGKVFATVEQKWDSIMLSHYCPGHNSYDEPN